MARPCLVAAAQLAPVFLDLEASVDLACSWIARAAREGVAVVVFPETWLPGYPIWLDVSPGAGLWDHPPAKRLFARLYEQSVTVPGPAVDRLADAARASGVAVVMGCHERQGKTLYNAMLYLSNQGELVGVHRKLVPTYTERMIWGQGDGATLVSVDSPAGRLGGLVCWEHWMPLARQAMHAEGETLHAALWPSVREMHLIASRAYAFEGRTFVVAVGSVLSRTDLPAGFELLDQMPGDGPWMTGGSAIIGPDGGLLAGPAGPEPTLLVAEIDPARIAEEALALDVCGHYARPDVFQFRVNRTRREAGGSTLEAPRLRSGQAGG
jgi:predicted amidohydrolase